MAQTLDTAGAGTAGVAGNRTPGLRGFAAAVWALAAAIVIALTAVWAFHWTRYAERARAHASNPVMAQFWLTWWSLAFPVGTCVTGTISLALRCHSDVRLFPAAISRALSV